MSATVSCNVRGEESGNAAEGDRVIKSQRRASLAAHPRGATAFSPHGVTRPMQPTISRMTLPDLGRSRDRPTVCVAVLAFSRGRVRADPYQPSKARLHAGMSPARQSFKDPSPDLPTQAKKSVEALLSTVSEARKTLGEPTALDRKVVDRDLGVILADFHFDGRQQGAKRPKLDEQPRTSLSALARAYARLTVHASLKTHCLTAFPWEEAIRIAEQRDKELAEGTIQAEKLPLLGLFFSIKDCI